MSASRSSPFERMMWHRAHAACRLQKFWPDAQSAFAGSPQTIQNGMSPMSHSPNEERIEISASCGESNHFVKSNSPLAAFLGRRTSFNGNNASLFFAKNHSCGSPRSENRQSLFLLQGSPLGRKPFEPNCVNYSKFPLFVNNLWILLDYQRFFGGILTVCLISGLSPKCAR